jgi:hypothetical protein
LEVVGCLAIIFGGQSILVVLFVNLCNALLRFGDI